MPWSSAHTEWLVDTKERYKTKDGREVEVWELRHGTDETILGAWAKHFRNHYCLDTEIDGIKSGTKLSREEFLKKIKFPSATERPGPSIRSGDFGEILIADYLEYILKYWVPRWKWQDKDVRNESKKGSDILGFKVDDPDKPSKDDELIAFETKGLLTGSKTTPKLQQAIEGSAEDPTRRPETLNALKQRLLIRNLHAESKVVARFQSCEDHPFKEKYGAAAIFSEDTFDADTVKSTDASSHPNVGSLKLLVVRGKSLMDLVHALYERAAREA